MNPLNSDEINDKSIPSMRFAITGSCNLKCNGCPVDGDSYLLHGKRLRLEDFIQIADAAYSVGIKHFSITGGEPLLFPEITFPLTEHIKKYPQLGYLRLNTNGIFLEKYINQVSELYTLVKIGLDSLRFGKYQNESSPVQPVLRAIEKLKTSIRINMVVGKRNSAHIDEMIQFCEDNEYELKLFDLTKYRDTVSQDSTFWQENYISLAPLLQEFEQRFGKPKIVYAIGGYGNPMPVFKAETKSQIKVRYSEKSAHYLSECIHCPDYQCQDGLCNITISTDGSIKPCRPEGLPFFPKLVEEGNLLPDQILQTKIKDAINIFKNSKRQEKISFCG